MPLDSNIVQVDGPKPKVIFTALNKAVLRMLPPIIHKAGKKTQLQAKDWAPVVSGK